MKKILFILLASALNFSYSSAQSSSSSISFGSALSLGGGLFTNSSTIGLVDDNFNSLGLTEPVGNDYQGNWGFANSTQALNDVSFSGIPFLELTSLNGVTAYIQSSLWQPLLSAVAPTPTPTNNYVIGPEDNSDTVSSHPNGAGIIITENSGVGGQGIGIEIIESPFTFQIIDETNGTVEIISCQITLSGNVIVPQTIAANLINQATSSSEYTVTAIADSAFENCNQITSITIPETVTSIGNNAFLNCTSLSEVNLPNSISSIGHSAFENCSSLSSIVLPNNLTIIEDDTFRYCSSLISVSLSENITQIKGFAFSGCSNLSDIALPESLQLIAYASFDGCSSIDSLIIPASVNRVESNAFGNCSGLSYIVFYDKPLTFDNIFSGSANPIIYIFPESTGWPSDGYFQGKSVLLAPVPDLSNISDEYVVKTTSELTINGTPSNINDYDGTTSYLWSIDGNSSSSSSVGNNSSNTSENMNGNGGDASVSFGSATAPGGILFGESINSLTLVDDVYNPIAGISTIVPGAGPGGVSGYANITETLNNVYFSGTPWLALTGNNGTGYIRSSNWGSLASATAPTPTPTNNFTLGASDTSTAISVSPYGMQVDINDGSGIFSSGVSVELIASGNFFTEPAVINKYADPNLADYSLTLTVSNMFGSSSKLISIYVHDDSDDDGLFDYVETNTGIFIDFYNTGTDPNDLDTDNDGLSDFHEVVNFSFIEGSYTWEEAKLDAINRGGHLATITSIEEWNKLTTFLDKIDYRNLSRGVALGGTDQNSEGVWEWVTGEPWTIEFWHHAEPNDSGDGNASEDYLGIYDTNPYTWYDFNNFNGSSLQNYVLEMPYTTDPNKSDTDGDGLNDSDELNIYYTNPVSSDTDNDGLNDGTEIALQLALDPNQATDLTNYGYYTKNEIADLRLDSVAFDVIDGVGKIYINVEETSNLEDPNGWEKVNGEHDGDHLIEVPVDLINGDRAKVFRLKFSN
jgi:hypothetical protein